MIGRIYRILILLVPTIMSAIGICAQELNCKVEINSDQVEGTYKQVFNTLEQAMNDYMNTNTFTNNQFSANEKIECRLFFTVKEYKDDKITGDLQIQSIRPVYNSTYTTTLVNFKDSKIDFTYMENEPLVFALDRMESQLTAILNFYAYLILAMDYDSFSPRGGEPYFERLKIIVQQAQSSGENGWKAFEDTKNRSAVLAAYTDKSTEGLRDLIYDYHRRGLDEMSVSPDKGRAKISESLSRIKGVYDASPMSVGLSMFKDSKLDELVNIYSKAPQQERTMVYNILQEVYPTETERLEKIKNGAENNK